MSGSFSWGLQRPPKWSPPSARPRVPDAQSDPHASLLSDLARCVLERVPKVLRDVRSASQGPVKEQTYENLQGTKDRAWRLRFRSVEAYCIVDEEAERELLRLIVGGAPGRWLSEIERRINAEAIGRLLQTDQGAELMEERRLRPVPPSWSCSVHLCGPERKGPKLDLYTACTSQHKVCAAHPRLESVALPLRAAIASGSCSLASVARWRQGSLVRLARGLDAPALLFAGGRRIARVRLGSLYGERAVMLTELLPGG